MYAACTFAVKMWPSSYPLVLQCISYSEHFIHSTSPLSLSPPAVNRMELHCSPTIIEEDGSRRLKDDDSDVLEVLEFDGRNDRDDDNRSECL